VHFNFSGTVTTALLTGLSAALLAGCGGNTQPATAKPQVFKPKTTISLRASTENSSELYFQKTRNLKFYTQGSGTVKNGWIDVPVHRSGGGGTVTFEVMTNVVTEKDYNGFGHATQGIGGITFTKANDYCMLKQNAQLMSPYVFDAAREQMKLHKPLLPITHEMIAPYDEDIDDEFAFSGDNIAVNEESDSSFIIMQWNSEKYFSVSNTYTSPKAAFRCMRRK
jgi:hypothetical protein